jgi:pyruvate dehydrogenase E2 component (dihydrolipoamide acetyltransferase)
MATEIVMPRLGWTMEEGVLVEWIKKDGDPVKVGDIIFTVESDKALNEVEAFEEGILRIPPNSPAPGTTIPVGGLLAYLVQSGEPLPFAQESAVRAAPPAVETVSTNVPVVASATLAPAKANGSTMPTISPRARRIAYELGVDWTQINGSGRTGRIVERDVRAALVQSPQPSVQAPSADVQPLEPVEVSPVARRAAQELGVDLAALGTQMNGKRITRQDVERAAAAPLEQPIQPTPPSGDQRIPISRIRSVIAERMSASSHTTAPVTLTTEVDATELVTLRKQLKSNNPAGKPVPSYNDLLAKLCAVALEEHPTLNARFEGEEIVISGQAHIGLAVDTERGLLVPVMRDVGGKSLRQIAGESAALIKGARAGTLKSDAMSGGTFTISSLGTYEIDAFTPIINLPQCAILGVGRIVPKVVVVDVEAEQTAIRHMLFLSLTFDHRLVDGAPAARFLQRVKQFVEQPYLWLVG